MDESAAKGLKLKGSDGTAAVPKSSDKSSKKRKKSVEGNSSNSKKKRESLIVKDLRVGSPNGKKAELGNMVTVHYTAKLLANGKIIDSEVGKSRYKFRLGVGHVIKGLDDGVNGMRVGGKRELTIPPAMGFGAAGLATKIPPDAWLVFDVELLNVHSAPAE